VGLNLNGIHLRIIPSTSKKNVIWVIVDRPTKSAHFLPIRDTWGVERFAELYVREIAQLHGIPTDITFDRDQRFQACFWKVLQKAFGTELNFSSSAHTRTGTQSEIVNQILEDMLKVYVVKF